MKMQSETMRVPHAYPEPKDVEGFHLVKTQDLFLELAELVDRNPSAHAHTVHDLVGSHAPFAEAFEQVVRIRGKEFVIFFIDGSLHRNE